jgi:hypothetical protein
MAKRTVFIIGTYFCGSTILGNCLNGHPSISFAGEIDRLEAFRCEPEWTHQREPGCRVCSTQDQYSCPVWPRDFLASLAPLQELDKYRAIVDRCETPIMVDGSKRIDWFNRLYDSGLTSGVAAIICARTPFAFANSKAGAVRAAPTESATLWRDFYMHAMRSLSGRGVPTLVVRYENFAFDPAKTIHRICEFLGVPFDPAMMTFWTTPSHAVGGNVGAYLRDPNFHASTLSQDEVWKVDYFGRRPFGGWVEDKWMYNLDEGAICRMMSVPFLGEVASLLGYDLSWFIQERIRILAQPKPAVAAAQ